MARKRARLTDENDPLTPTDQVLEGLASLSRPQKKSDKSTSQQAEKTESQLVEADKSMKASKVTMGQPASQQVDKLDGQESDKLTLKKATFQLSKEVLQELDRLHLRLQLNMGKANAPYKEVIVEEAIATFLADFERKQERRLKALTRRQDKR